MRPARCKSQAHCGSSRATGSWGVEDWPAVTLSPSTSNGKWQPSPGRIGLAVAAHRWLSARKRSSHKPPLHLPPPHVARSQSSRRWESRPFLARFTSLASRVPSRRSPGQIRALVQPVPTPATSTRPPAPAVTPRSPRAIAKQVWGAPSTGPFPARSPRTLRRTTPASSTGRCNTRVKSFGWSVRPLRGTSGLPISRSSNRNCVTPCPSTGCTGKRGILAVSLFVS